VTSDGSRRRHQTSSDPAFRGTTRRLARQPFLMLAFDASRPLHGGARFSLAGVDEVVIAEESLSEDLRNLTALARTRTPVTLVGETGTGKELVASAIHALSSRRGPYKAVNCASAARSLIESEFFGYVRGAFSGADRNHPGHIEAASGGTLLLDEILTTPPELQAALLRFLQQGEVLAVCGRTPIPVDVRVIAAAQISLERAAADDHFRPDLKARLEGFVLNLLPLRERIPDMGIFVAHELRAQGGPATMVGTLLTSRCRPPSGCFSTNGLGTSASWPAPYGEQAPSLPENRSMSSICC